MATTHIQEMTHSGVYSVYFAVLGGTWYSVDTTQGKGVHDEIVVK